MLEKKLSDEWLILERSGKSWYEIFCLLLKGYVSLFRSLKEKRSRVHKPAIDKVLYIHFPSNFSMWLHFDRDEDYTGWNFLFTLFQQLNLLKTPLAKDDYLSICLSLLRDKGYIADKDYEAFMSIGGTANPDNPFYDPRDIYYYMDNDFFSSAFYEGMNELKKKFGKAISDAKKNGVVDVSCSGLNDSHMHHLMDAVYDSLSRYACFYKDEHAYGGEYSHNRKMPTSFVKELNFRRNFLVLQL